MIVGAFMAGLGLGSYAGGLLSTRLDPRRAFWSFASLELAAAFGAVSVVLYYDVLYLRAAGLYATPLGAGVLHARPQHARRE